MIYLPCMATPLITIVIPYEERLEKNKHDIRNFSFIHSVKSTKLFYVFFYLQSKGRIKMYSRANFS